MKFDKKIVLGYNKERELIFLSPPSWDCDWYWGFGYLGNRNSHYHVDGLMKEKDLYNGFKEHFGNSFRIKEENDIWKLAELFTTFYHLKKAAEIYGSGGSHKEKIINLDEVNRINKTIMPLIFDEIYNILIKYPNPDCEKLN